MPNRTAHIPKAPILPGLLFLMCVLFLLSFTLGPAHLPLQKLWQGLMDGHGLAGAIARDIRLPRALLGILVGAALGGSGAALQGLFRNPLAEPGVTGVTASAGLGAVIAIYFGFAATTPLLLPVFAVTGALISAVILFLLTRAGAGVIALILAGVAISSFAAALTALAMTLAPNPYALSEIVMWMIGSLKDRSMVDVAYALPLILVGTGCLIWAARGLDALSLGEDAAESLGVSVPRVQRLVVFGVALATGAATAAAGAVSFVGLVVPHLLRPLCGYKPSQLILPSAIGGAVLVLAADILLRALMPDGRVLLGVVTAMIGAPFFFWLIYKMRGQA